MTLYFAWNYATGLTTTYERSGECNDCGDCCRALIRFVHQGVNQEELQIQGERKCGGKFTDGQGIWQGYDAADGTRLYKVQEIVLEADRCSWLDLNNRCMNYAERSMFCQQWPLHPDDLTLFPRCGYTFLAVTQSPFSFERGQDADYTQS